MQGGSQGQLLLNDWYVLAWVERDRALNPLESLDDLIAVLVAGCVVVDLTIPDDYDATLVAQILQRLLHHLKVLVVWHLVGHEDKQNVRVLVLSVR